ncbi:uncharacterized protein LOC113333199 [Papaver somniferum]|uniref:uncharacterized protein LOC113333199 n=1 Tax=Papaver somniferum TaxID=3469 RepID=UPI000E6FE6AC|nr:uncharacterized protein LOC113333199 [Papaver somniferum]
MAKEWFYSLPAGSITTWTSMKKHFLEKYFPASKVAKIRKEICGIVQMAGLLLNDTASGGALVDKTPAQARSLIENMTFNSQQFSSRAETLVKKVNEVGEDSHMEQRMCNMERMMQQISAVIVPSYANNQAAANPTFNQQGGYQFMQRPQQETQGTSVDDNFTLMMQGMQDISKTMQGFNQFQQKYEMTMRDVQNQVSQLANDINLVKAQGSEKLPSQPLNHKENVNVIELRSGKQVKQPETSSDANGPVLDQEEDETAPNKDDLVTNSHSKPLVSTNVTPPFPSRFAKSKKETLYKEIYEGIVHQQAKINW